MAIFKTRTTSEWCDVLRAVGVRYAPVRDYAETAADPGVWENGYLAEVADDSGETRRVVGTPIRMSETPLAPGSRAPMLCASTPTKCCARSASRTTNWPALREQGTI